MEAVKDPVVHTAPPSSLGCENDSHEARKFAFEPLRKTAAAAPVSVDSVSPVSPAEPPPSPSDSSNSSQRGQKVKKAAVRGRKKQQHHSKQKARGSSRFSPQPIPYGSMSNTQRSGTIALSDTYWIPKKPPHENGVGTVGLYSNVPHPPLLYGAAAENARRAAAYAEWRSRHSDLFRTLNERGAAGRAAERERQVRAEAQRRAARDVAYADEVYCMRRRGFSILTGAPRPQSAARYGARRAERLAAYAERVAAEERRLAAGAALRGEIARLVSEHRARDAARTNALRLAAAAERLTTREPGALVTGADGLALGSGFGSPRLAAERRRRAEEVRAESEARLAAAAAERAAEAEALREAHSFALTLPRSSAALALSAASSPRPATSGGESAPWATAKRVGGGHGRSPLPPLRDAGSPSPSPAPALGQSQSQGQAQSSALGQSRVRTPGRGPSSAYSPGQSHGDEEAARRQWLRELQDGRLSTARAEVALVRAGERRVAEARDEAIRGNYARADGLRAESDALRCRRSQLEEEMAAANAAMRLDETIQRQRRRELFETMREERKLHATQQRKAILEEEALAKTWGEADLKELRNRVARSKSPLGRTKT